MSLRIATWNINSIRLRIELIERLIAEEAPDILCLQETKTPDPFFPAELLMQLGYPYQVYTGMKSYNGVAILSRYPFLGRVDTPDCWGHDCRHIGVTFALAAGEPDNLLRIDNFYVPAGGDEPDPDSNPKFAHKIRFLSEMNDWSLRNKGNLPKARILLGDLNIAPMENDVWSHRQLLGIVSHTPGEVSALNKVLESGEWIDVARHFVPAQEKLYSWWSYRNRDWHKSNRGRRLDHIWAGANLMERLAGIKMVKGARDWPKPSDHVPVIGEFSLRLG